jgi:carboxypeptidase Q
VKAEAIVVQSFDELEAKKDQIKGKIVVYNQGWTTYFDTVAYRSTGADRAAKYGAVAALVRSVASYSIYSVHAGVQQSTAIPVAALTVEDADMLLRMQNRGQKIVLELTLENESAPNTNSNNLVFEVKGSEKPDEILLMGGHIDSWDTGSQTGANDDGGGFLTCYEAMRLILQLGLRPKRTLRFIAWSGEEWGDPRNGNKAYLAAHLNELDKHIVAFEDDLGSTKLKGFGYIGDPKGKEVVQMIADKYMGILNAAVVNDAGEAVDTGPLYEKGVPTMANVIEDTPDHKYYFSYHHSAGDSMTMMNADDMDSNVVGLAAMMFILADLDNTIPRPGIGSNKNLQAES